MNVTISAYPAKNGDCFLISFGHTDTELKHLLIDCGYPDTVNNYLKNCLKEIGKNAGCIEKMILTHIDADHILGAISLLQDNNEENFIEIKEIWHNTYRHLFNLNAAAIDKKQERIVRQIVQRGYPSSYDQIRSGKEISAKQGTTVGALILKGNYKWNNDFSNKAVCIEQTIKSVIVDENTEIILLSPNRKKLDQLKDLWKDELRRYDVNFENNNLQFYDDAFEMLMSWDNERPKKQSKKISASEESITELLARPFDEDNTPTNGSSIAFILNIQDKKLLFLADAHPDIITKSLNEYQIESLIVFDLIKVSHHGSFRNINDVLLEKIDAHRYLFSTNGGRHNHPDKETIAHIVCRTTCFKRELYFNYETSTSKYFDRDDWKKEYNYSINYLNKAPYQLSL